MKSKMMVKMGHKKRFWPGAMALWEIQKFQKSTELLILKMSFLGLIKEIIQCDHRDHFIQAGAVLALHEATEAYIIRLLKDTNLCTIHTKCITILPCDKRLARRIWGENVKINNIKSLYYRVTFIVIFLLLCHKIYMYGGHESDL